MSHVWMQIGELEELAGHLYREARYTDCEQAPLVTLANRLLGPNSVRLVPASALPGNGALARVGAHWRVYLRRDASQVAKRFVLLHELAHWALGSGGSEEECDALAAALLAPRRAFLLAVAALGSDFGALAAHFGASESCVALRLGEATGCPLALITPRAVRLRGSVFSWPDERALRAKSNTQRPGLRKARLRDEPERVVLVRAL